jgi:hypothetical protein
VDVLAAEAVTTLVRFELGKPVLLAESGAVEPSHSGPFKLYEKDRAGIILHDVLFAPFFAGAAGAGQIWHWDSYVAANDLWRHFGRFAEFVRGLDPAEEQFVPSVTEEAPVRIYRLTGKRTTLLWLRDTRNDWRSELERGEAPQLVRGFKPPVAARARFYDPWDGRWSNGHTRDVPEFRRSLCVKLSS